MKDCALLHDYRDGLLAQAESASFEKHLAACPECRRTVALWSALEQELGEMDREGVQRIPRPSPAATQELISRARGEGGIAFSPILVGAAAAVALVIVGVVILLARTGDDPASEGRDRVADREPTPAAVEAMVHFIAPADSRTESISLSAGDRIPSAEDARTLLRLGRDRIGFGEPTEAVLSAVDERAVRVSLRRGAIACEVAPRAEGQLFEIRAGEVTVRVVGTRFLVRRGKESTQVLVDEGAVEVRREGEPPVTTRAGQGLEILQGGRTKAFDVSERARTQLIRLVSQDEPKQDPTREIDDSKATPTESAEPGSQPGKAAGHGAPAAGLREWRAWVLAGRYDEAERAIEAHLAAKPNDAEALVLLADCRRKAGKWRAAVSTYERLVRTAAPSRANTARFKAGVLYQERLGDHAAAARMFDGYLKASGAAKPLEAEAMLRLGRSLLALGRTQRAEAVLRATAERQDGSMASVRARKLLKKISGEK